MCSVSSLKRNKVRKLATSLESKGYVTEYYDNSSGVFIKSTYGDHLSSLISYCKEISSVDECHGTIFIEYDNGEAGLLGQHCAAQGTTAELNYIT
jgi:hypothetical protein